MSVSRKPAARTRPGSLHLRKIPEAAKLSTVRVVYDNRLATSARRINRGTVETGCSRVKAGGDRKKAIMRVRSSGATAGSANSADRII